MSKKSQLVIGLLIVLVVAGGGVAALLKKQADARRKAVSDHLAIIQHKGYLQALAKGEDPLRPPGYAETPSVSGAVDHMITYSPAGFGPARLEVKAGATVVFMGDSWTEKRLFIAADKPPSAEVPARYQGCAGVSAPFCFTIPSSEAVPIVFTGKGTWAYRNAERPEHKGVIVVD